MTIITYEAQHVTLVAGLSARLIAKQWSQLASDATDIATLETLIGAAPTKLVELVPGIQTVMAQPLPNK